MSYLVPPRTIRQESLREIGLYLIHHRELRCYPLNDPTSVSIFSYSVHQVFEEMLVNPGNWAWIDAALNCLTPAEVDDIQRQTHNELMRLRPSDVMALSTFIKLELTRTFEFLQKDIEDASYQKPHLESWLESLAMLGVRYYSVVSVTLSWGRRYRPLPEYRKSLYYTDTQRRYVVETAALMRNDADSGIRTEGKGHSRFWKKVARKVGVGGNAPLVMFSRNLMMYHQGIDWEKFRESVFDAEREIEEEQEGPR